MFDIVKSIRDGIAYATAYGEFEPSAFIQSFGDLFKDPDFHRGMPIIFDSSGTTNNGVRSPQMQQAAVSLADIIGLHEKPWPFAWVNGDAFAHLVLKIIEARLLAKYRGFDRYPPALRHFMNMSEAEEWVRTF